MVSNTRAERRGSRIGTAATGMTAASCGAVVLMAGVVAAGMTVDRGRCGWSEPRSGGTSAGSAADPPGRLRARGLGGGRA